jgi:hypothetical protein
MMNTYEIYLPLCAVQIMTISFIELTDAFYSPSVSNMWLKYYATLCKLCTQFLVCQKHVPHTDD